MILVLGLTSRVTYLVTKFASVLEYELLLLVTVGLLLLLLLLLPMNHSPSLITHSLTHSLYLLTLCSSVCIMAEHFENLKKGVMNLFKKNDLPLAMHAGTKNNGVALSSVNKYVSE
jgi:hypothetical protein